MKSFNDYQKETGEVGYLEEILHSVAYASGLPSVKSNELVMFETGEIGQVLGMQRDQVEILVFSRSALRIGTKIARTNEYVQIPVGEELLGHIIDPLGNSFDRLTVFDKPKNFRLVHTSALGIGARKRINKPFTTGVSLVDLIVPLGRGQRELIIGDRKTGKTVFLLNTIVKQAQEGSICIYTAIGKKKTDIKKVEEFFVKNGIMQQTIIVGASALDPAGMLYLAPYAAMSVAEYFRDQGRDVLLVLDDMMSHAKAYREVCLLAKRFPGRNSYPGDMFYAQARLLERAGNFVSKGKESSITCLPVAETTQGDLSGYIQTNLTSITDGHIFFDSDLFTKGRRPAINPFLSVTRVGRQTQTQLSREINRELVSFLTLYEKMQRFIHFGAELTEIVKNTITTGDRIFNFFDHTSGGGLPSNLSLFLFSTLWIGTWQTAEVGVMKKDLELIIKAYHTNVAFKQKVDQIISNSTGWNPLLGNLRKEIDGILAMIIKSAQAVEAPPNQPSQVQKPVFTAQTPVQNPK